MTDLREALFNYFESITTFTVINAMVQFTEPSAYLSFFILNDTTTNRTSGIRVYNQVEDIHDIIYGFATVATVQIDIRGAGSYGEAKRIFFLLQTAQLEMKDMGLHYKEVNNLTPIPNIQNGYVKEGYQFNLVVGYEASTTKQTETGETLIWH